MSIIGALPVTLTNGTTADANQVMTDFNFIVSQVNTNGASLASPAFTGTITGVNLTLSGAIIGNSTLTLSGGINAATLTLSGAASVGSVFTVGSYQLAPNTPAFLASNTSAGDVSVSLGSVIAFGSTAGSGFNVGGSYNTSTSTFTAPVTGYYQVETGLTFRNSGGATGYMEIGLFVNGTQTGNGSFGFLAIGCTPNSAGGTVTSNMVCTIRLSAADTLTIQPTTNTTTSVRYSTASAYFGARLVG